MQFLLQSLLQDFLETSNIPDKKIFLDRLQREILIRILSSKGEIIPNELYNGSLDFPPEILIKIFKGCDWDVNLRQLTSYLYNIFTELNTEYKIIVKSEEDLKIAQSFSQDVKLVVKVYNFIPQTLSKIDSLTYNYNIFRDSQVEDLINLFRINDSDLPISRINDSDLPISRSSNKVKSLSFNDNDIPGNLLEDLFAVLFGNTTLTSLTLAHNHLGFYERSYDSIIDYLSINKSLMILSLRDNSLGDNDAQKLATILVNNTTLKQLDLSSNRISGTGLDFLATALGINITLELLDLTNNSLIGNLLVGKLGSRVKF